MELTEELKAKIDAMTHYELLDKIRYAKVGDPLMQGDSGGYVILRREILRQRDPAGAVADSKALGWER